jgi:hydroxyacylglutathione hydrolase
MSLKIAIIPVTPFEQNCSILICDELNEAAIVDPGGDLDRIRETISELKVKVTKILITHGHLDHCAGAKDLADSYGVMIEGPQKEETFWIDQLIEQSQRFGFGHAKPFTPNRWLEDGDQVTVGKQILDVYHCPGHTPGHVVFVDRQAKLAVVGDVLFAGSIGRTDFPRGNHGQLIRSIQEKLFPLGDDIAFIPGHGPMSTFGEEKINNPYVGLAS